MQEWGWAYRQGSVPNLKKLGMLYTSSNLYIVRLRALLCKQLHCMALGNKISNNNHTTLVAFESRFITQCLNGPKTLSPEEGVGL